jgi:CRP-like cAMP-binding protein
MSHGAEVELDVEMEAAMTTTMLTRTDRGLTPDLFDGITARQRAAIRRLSTEVAVEPGRVLLREGQSSRQFFVVNAGRARVTVGGVYVGCIEAGSFAGEMSLFDLRPCVATVTAATPMHLQVFAPVEFRALMDLGIPGLAEQMLRTVSERLRAVDERFRALAGA